MHAPLYCLLRKCDQWVDLVKRLLLCPYRKQSCLLVTEWMHEKGAVFYYEVVEVAEEPVARCRGRYRWDDGASVEYELTDIGPTPNSELVKSLGFNFDQENSESDRGYTAAYEMD